MSDHGRCKTFCRKALKPITIMFIPHDNPGRSLNLNVPVVGVLLSVICCFVGAAYIFFMIPGAIRYHGMEKQFMDYSRKMTDFNATLSSLNKTEKDLRQLTLLGSKDQIFEKVNTPGMDYYAQNKISMVQVIRKVKRGDVIGYLSSTGSTAKSRGDYEIRHKGRSENTILLAGRKS